MYTNLKSAGRLLHNMAPHTLFAHHPDSPYAGADFSGSPTYLLVLLAHYSDDTLAFYTICVP